MNRSSAFDDHALSSQDSPFSPPPHSYQGLGYGRSHPKVLLTGLLDFEAWSNVVVSLFIQSKLLGDILVLKLRCLPPQAKEIVAAEQAFWARMLNLKVLSELKLQGLVPPSPFVPRVFGPPVEMKFEPPTFANINVGTIAERKALIASAKEYYENARSFYDADQLTIAARQVELNALAFKEYEIVVARFDKDKAAALSVLQTTCMDDARMALWLQIIPTLGESFYKINETVDFGRPGLLLAAIEIALYRNPEGERTQLLLAFWAATLVLEGKGDPIQFHRWILLAGRRLAILADEPIRDADMKTVLIKGLPDEIFLGFKTGLHNNPASTKSFDDVFQILKIFSSSEFAKPKIDDLIKKIQRQWVQPPPGVFVVPRPTTTVSLSPCFDFKNGKCGRGASCKFSHAPASVGADMVCSHCSKKGHKVEACFTKFPEKRPVRKTRPPPYPPKVAQVVPARSGSRQNLLLTLQQNVEELLCADDDPDGDASVFVVGPVGSASFLKMFPPLPARSGIIKSIPAPRKLEEKQQQGHPFSSISGSGQDLSKPSLLASSFSGRPVEPSTVFRSFCPAPVPVLHQVSTLGCICESKYGCDDDCKGSASTLGLTTVSPTTVSTGVLDFVHDRLSLTGLPLFLNDLVMRYVGDAGFGVPTRFTECGQFAVLPDLPALSKRARHYQACRYARRMRASMVREARQDRADAKKLRRKIAKALLRKWKKNRLLLAGPRVPVFHAAQTAQRVLDRSAFLPVSYPYGVVSHKASFASLTSSSLYPAQTRVFPRVPSLPTYKRSRDSLLARSLVRQQRESRLGSEVWSGTPKIGRRACVKERVLHSARQRDRKLLQAATADPAISKRRTGFSWCAPVRNPFCELSSPAVVPEVDPFLFFQGQQCVPAPGGEVAVVLMLQESHTILHLAGVDSSRVLVDGGATIHATPDEHLCFDVGACSVSIAGVGGLAFVCHKRGKMVFQPAHRVVPIVLSNVHISSEFPTTFVSESVLVRKGCSIFKNSAGGAVRCPSGLLFKLEEKDGLYYAVGVLSQPPQNSLLLTRSVLPNAPFECDDVPAALAWIEKCVLCPVEGDALTDDSGLLLMAKVYSKKDVSDLLGRYHRRMSHISFKRVAMAFGIKLPADFEPPLCNACVIGKQKNVPHHEGARLRATRPCAGLHIDFCGPFPHISLYGSRYLLIFKCDFTGFVWDFYTKSQSEFYEIFVALMARISNQFSLANAVIWIRSDNGKVFTDGRVREFCLQKGIRHEFSAPYSQWQNGAAERMFQTILNLAVSSLHQSGLLHRYWEDSVRLAVLCINRIGEPANKNLDKGFPEMFSRLERLHGVAIPTRLNGIYPLGVLAYARVPRELRRKFEPKAVACIYLGLHESIKGARLLELDANRVTVSAVFTISEGHFPLMISTVATASKDFMAEHSVRDASESPSVIWPAMSSNADYLALNGPKITKPLPVVSSARPIRQWAPSSQALQNIAAASDNVDRRTYAGDDSHPEVESVAQPVFVVSSASSSLSSSMDIVGSEFCFLNPVTPWIFENDDFFLDSCSSTSLVLTVASYPSTVGVPCDRHEYLAQTPTSHSRAHSSPHAYYWDGGERKEVASHIKNETFGPLLPSPPAGFRLLPINAVYRNKFSGEGKIAPGDLPPESWKARLVILGFLMVSGRDFDATFAPTAAPTSIRMLAVLAARLRYVVKVGDVETAFLVPKMDKVVYVKALLWYEQVVASILGLPVPVDLPPNACRQLLKGVPGIKQGSRLFYLEIKRVLLSLGFTVHPADPCVYLRLPGATTSSGCSTLFAAIAVWVDDVFAVVANDDEWSSLLAGLRSAFSITDKGDVKMFLGMEILQSADRSVITLSQRISVDNLLSRAYGSMKSQNPAPTPCVAGFVFTKTDCPSVVLSRPSRMPEFRGLIALANYISVWTRPDITYVVNKLCKYMANPGDKHIDVFERLLRYLVGTRGLGLVYAPDGAAVPLVAYSDSSHMDCVDSSRSTLAYLFFFFGQVVSWYSKLHSFVTTCSNHSEYAAMFQAAKEAQSIFSWLSPLLSFLGITVVPIPVFNDNDGASALALDPVGRFKNKHVRMEHHYTQELVAANVIVPVRVDTSENKSDILTKALGPTVFPPIAKSLVGSVSSSASRAVLMFRVVPTPSSDAPASSLRPALRVIDVGTQCSDLPYGGLLEPISGLSVALDVVRAFNADICAVSQDLALLQQRMLSAAIKLQSRLDDLRIARAPPHSDDSENGADALSRAAPVEAVGSVCPVASASTRAQVNVTRPLSPRSALFCSYCRKLGHDLAQCRRSVNDHKYLKRGR